jgi:hypothetical protein
VARWAAVDAGLALVAQADLRAVVDAGRDGDLEGAVDPHDALAAALLAGVGDDRAVAVAAVADADVDELAEEVLVDPPQLAATAAAGALGRRAAGLDALAGALGAGLVLLEGDLALEPEDRLLELEGEVDPQVGAPLDPLTLAGAGGGPEERLEQVLDTDPAAPPEGAAADPAVDAEVAEAVVGRTLLAVGQDLVGLLDLLEAVGRAGLGVPIRVVLQHQPPVRLADVVLAGAPADAQDFVVIAFRRGHAALHHRARAGCMVIPSPAQEAEEGDWGRGSPPSHQEHQGRTKS